MDEYLKNENAWLFWSCMSLAAIACLLIIRYYWLACKVVTPTIEDENPIKYKIDGKSMSEEEARCYYFSELDRQRRKNTLHLIIYDSENHKVMFDDLASIHYEPKKDNGK